MHLARFLPSAALTVVVSFSAQYAPAQFATTTTIATTGQTAPGAGAGATFLSTVAGGMNEVGQATFQASLQSPSVTTSGWKWSAGTLTLAAKVGDTPVGLPGTTFSSVRVPIINDTGDLAFRAQVTGAGITLNVNDFGIWQYGPTGNSLRVITGSSAVGYFGGQTITGLGVQAFNNGRAIGFASNVSGTSGWGALGNAAFYGQGSAASFTLSRPLANGVGLPSLSPAVIPNGASTTSFVNSSRQILAAASTMVCSPDLTSCFDDLPKLFLLNPDGATPIQTIVGNTTLPGVGTLQVVPSVLSFNNAGTALFVGFVSGNNILCTGTTSGCVALVRNGDAMPPPSTATFFAAGSFTNGGIDGTGRVTFTARFTEPIERDTGIFYRSAAGVLSTIALEGSHAAGRPGYVVFSDLSTVNTLCINGNGDVAFVATMRGPGITAANDRALYIWIAATGLLVPVMAEGETFGGKIVSDISFNLNSSATSLANGSGPQDGRARAIGRSSTGATQLVFGATFTDTTTSFVLAGLPASVTGACCIAGSCTMTAPASCGGTYLGNFEACAPNPCIGACCTASECTVGMQSACAGLYQGNASTCALVPCTGGCCIAGACSTTTQAACTGTYQGNNASCTPNPCDPAPTGACCVVLSGACNVLTSAACAAQSPPGAFQGPATTCTPNLCPQPTGACCVAATGACNPVTSAACAAQAPPGAYQGVNTACGPNPCPQPQACCTANVCSVVIPTACAGGGGTMQAGNSCSPDPCVPPGVCCRGATCSTSAALQSQAACAASLPVGDSAGAKFMAPGSCGVSHSSPCCYADYTQNGTRDVGDIFVYLGGWFGSSPFTVVGGSGAGAPNVGHIFAFLTAWFAGGCP